MRYQHSGPTFQRLLDSDAGRRILERLTRSEEEDINILKTFYHNVRRRHETTGGREVIEIADI